MPRAHTLFALKQSDPRSVKKQKQMKNPTLPFELIVEILLRLPARSLLRFKCVCKSWLSLISDPQFAKSHFDLGAAPTHRLLMNFTSDCDGDKIKSLDFEASKLKLLNLNLPYPPPAPGGTDFPQGLGSCRGFVLLANSQVDLAVWNPSTGIRKRIPGFYYESYSVLYGIGYDSSTDDYLVVIMRLMDIVGWRILLEYFSLKTNSWCDTQYIDSQYADIRFGLRSGLFLNSAGLFFNGAIHWLVLSDHINLYVIIVFDLMERSLSEIPLPLQIPLPLDLAMGLTLEVYYLRVMGECLSLCYSDEGYTEIWVMKEYKVHSSWTKSFVFYTNDIPCNPFLPIYITKCGGIFGSNGCETLVNLNDKGELLEHCTYMQERGLYSWLHYPIYRESLLSLPSHSEKQVKMINNNRP